MSLYWKMAGVAVAAFWLGSHVTEMPPVYAQSESSNIYIEPATTLIRDPNTGVQMQGKVVIDRRTGDVWGFPTASSAPFPVAVGSKEPPVSKPVYLGKFDFAAMRK